MNISGINATGIMITIRGSVNIFAVSIIDFFREIGLNSAIWVPSDRTSLAGGSIMRPKTSEEHAKQIKLIYSA